MRRLALLFLLCSPAAAQTYFTAATRPACTSNLPREIFIRDATTQTDCSTAGGGTAEAHCCCQDAVWAACGTAAAAASSGGNSFETINAPSGTDPVADSPTDTLNLVASGGVSIVGTAGTDTITISSSADAFDTVNTDAGTSPVAAGSSTLTLHSGAAALSITGNSGTDTVTFDISGTASKCARFDGSGELVPASGDCSSGSGGLSDADYGDFTVTGGVATIDANAVALGTDTTGNYALGDAEGGAATTGDSATAFFSSGQIEAARGGTGDDTSGTTGVPRIAAGNWTYDAGVSHLASSTSADLRGVLSDETGTGAAMFGLTTAMSDDISATALQVVRRNAADNAWEAVSSPSLSPPASTIRCYSEFFTRITYATQTYLESGGCFSAAASNTNAAWNTTVGTATHPGIASFTTGTTASGGVVAHNSDNSVLFGGGQWIFEGDVSIPNLSISTQRFIVQAGFVDGLSSVPYTVVDGVFFQYSDNINGGEWFGVCSNNSTTSGSTVDSNIAVSGATFYKLKIVVNAAASSAEFFVDGSSVGTCSSNIPTAAGRETGVGFSIGKTVGITTARTLEIDYAGYEWAATTAR